MHEEKITG